MAPIVFVILHCMCTFNRNLLDKLMYYFLHFFYLPFPLLLKITGVKNFEVYCHSSFIVLMRNKTLHDILARCAGKC